MRAHLEKGGYLGAGPTRKKGGLRCGSGKKGGSYRGTYLY